MAYVYRNSGSPNQCAVLINDTISQTNLTVPSANTRVESSYFLKIKSAIDNLETYNSQCVENCGYSNCCQSCQACQSCQSDRCQSCQTCQGCQSCQSQSCQSECK